MKSVFYLYAKYTHNRHWKCVCSSTDVEWLQKQGNKIIDDRRLDCEFNSYMVLDEELV